MIIPHAQNFIFEKSCQGTCEKFSEVNEMTGKNIDGISTAELQRKHAD